MLTLVKTGLERILPACRLFYMTWCECETDISKEEVQKIIDSFGALSPFEPIMHHQFEPVELGETWTPDCRERLNPPCAPQR